MCNSRFVAIALALMQFTSNVLASYDSIGKDSNSFHNYHFKLLLNFNHNKTLLAPRTNTEFGEVLHSTFLSLIRNALITLPRQPDDGVFWGWNGVG